MVSKVSLILTWSNRMNASFWVVAVNSVAGILHNFGRVIFTGHTLQPNGGTNIRQCVAALETFQAFVWQKSSLHSEILFRFRPSLFGSRWFGTQKLLPRLVLRKRSSASRTLQMLISGPHRYFTFGFTTCFPLLVYFTCTFLSVLLRRFRLLFATQTIGLRPCAWALLAVWIVHSNWVVPEKV